jgi:hypothetical protein
MKHKDELIRYGREDMPKHGMLPLLDLDPQDMRIDYDERTDSFIYQLKIPGVEHPEAERYIGILSSGMIIGSPVDMLWR